MAEPRSDTTGSGAQASNPRKSGARWKGYLALALSVVAIAAGIAVYLRLFSSGVQSTDDAAVAGNQAVVSSQILAQIVDLSAKEGQSIARGEVVVRLDDATLQAQEHQAEVNAQLASGNVKLAQVKLEQAKSDLDRATLQLRIKVIPQEQYDHLRQAFEATSASYAIAVSQQKLADAELRTAEANLERTSIASQVDGVVAKKWVTQGDVVQPAQPIYTIYDLSKLWVEADFKETQLSSIKVGDRAVITVDAFPGRTFQGRVEDIGAAAASAFALIPQDNGAGNFTKVTQRVPVRIAFDGGSDRGANAGARLLPGMSAEVKVRTGEE